MKRAKEIFKQFKRRISRELDILNMTFKMADKRIHDIGEPRGG